MLLPVLYNNTSNLLWTYGHCKSILWRFPVQFSSVQSLSSPTLCNPMDCSMLNFPVHHQLLEPIQTHVHWVSNTIQPSYSLLSPFSPAFNLCQYQGLFKWVSSSHKVSKVLEFQLQHQSLQWILRIDLLYNGLVLSPCCPRDSQESPPTPQFRNINSLVLNFLYSSTLISVHDWNNHTGKTIALTRQTFVDKVMSLLFNKLSRLVIIFLSRSKCPLISQWLSPFVVILEPPKINSLTVSTVSPSICHEVMELDAMILVSECWVLNQLFHSPLSFPSRGFLVPLCFLP